MNEKQERLTPLRAIRAHCISCVGNVVADVRECGGNKVAVFKDESGACLFMPYWMGRGRPKLKLIRKFCMVCQGDQQSWVRECHETWCCLHPYRMGKNPAKKGQGNIENMSGNAT
jgi:hypothetical protein